MSASDGRQPPAEDAELALLRGFRTEPLSVEALNRVRVAATAQWREVSGRTPTPLWPKRHVAIAAAIALVSLVSAFFLVGQTNRSTAVLGTLARADYPGAFEIRRLAPDHPLLTGTALHAGQLIVVRGGARIELQGSGSLRLAPGTRVAITSGHLVKLLDGSLYLDIPLSREPQLPFAVQTPAGTFTHVGTQFQVAVLNGHTVLRVREGQVRWSSASGDLVSAAGTQLSIDRDGKVTHETVAGAGVNWRWAEDLNDSFAIEGRSLADFLRQIARETGRTLSYSNPAVESHAATTILHGSMDNSPPLDALSTVIATTTMRFTLGGNSIRIESSSDQGQSDKK